MPPAPVSASPAGEHRPRLAAAISGLASPLARTELASERLLPLSSPLAELFGTPGLARGSTLLLESSSYPGATSLALALLTAPSREGRWCALFGPPRPATFSPGLLAAAELGLDLERLVVVPGAPGREGLFLATLLEGCDLVLALLERPLASAEARRLLVRARERRGVLLLLDLRPPTTEARPLWPEPCDLTVQVSGGHFLGPGEEGRITSRLLEVTVRRRRGSPRLRHGRLWLPDREGHLRYAGSEEESVAPPAEAALGH